MSTSLARIPMHRCPPAPPRRPPEARLGRCDCPDSRISYVPHPLCPKSSLYRVLDNYLLHHPGPGRSASYM